MVGFGRIEPPAVVADVAEQATIHVLPINIARLGIVGIVGSCSAVQRPGGEVNKHLPLFELLVLWRFRSEAGPAHDKEFSVQLVDVFYPFFGIRETLGIEGLSVPGAVGLVVLRPVLPILYNDVDRHTQLAMFPEDTQVFVLCMVSVFALEKAIRPQGEHGGFPGEFAHFGNYTVRGFPEHEIIVGTMSQARKGQFLRGICKFGYGIIVPVDAVSFGRGHEIGRIGQGVFVPHLVY